MSQVWHNPNSQSNEASTANDAASSNERTEKEPPLQGAQPSFVQPQQRITLPSLSALNAKDEDRREGNGNGNGNGQQQQQQQPLASHSTRILGYPPAHSNVMPSITTDSALKQPHDYHPHSNSSSSSSPSSNTAAMAAAAVAAAGAAAPAPAPAPAPASGLGSSILLQEGR